MTEENHSADVSRRKVLLSGAGLIAISVLPFSASADDGEMADAVKKLFGDRKASEAKVALKLPALAESGNSVPLSVTVESAMAATDRVKQIAIFSSRNPRPLIAQMYFGPKAGKAAFDTNIRLSGTQDVVVIAEMADGSLYSAKKLVKVTVGACDTLQIRY